MKVDIRSVFVTMFFCFSLGLVHAESYTLEQYLKRVQQKNPDLALAYKEVELAGTAVSQARAAFLPVIGVQGGYTRNLTDLMKSTPIASVSGGGPLVWEDVDSNFDNELSLGVGVTQTLFDASSISNYNKAKKARAIREQSLEAVRLTIQCEAKKLYARSQLVFVMVEIMESTEQFSLETYESTKRKYLVGAAAELDLLMAEVDWKTKANAVTEARKNAELVLVAFRNLAGIPLTERVTLSGIPELPAGPSGRGSPLDTMNTGGAAGASSGALSDILASRPDYRSLVFSRELADIDHRAALGSLLPTAAASFSYAMGSMGNGTALTGGADFNQAALSLTVNVPIFTGGYRLARIKAARLEQDKAGLALSKKRDTIESELIEISLRLDEAVERLESASLIVKTAERAATLAQSAYANGLTTLLSTSEAVNRLGQARLGYQSAVFEYRSAFYDWEHAAGLE